MDRILQLHLDLLNALRFPVPTPATGSLVFAISILTSLWSSSNFFEDLMRSRDFFSIPSSYFKREVTFDYIIVGGGSAGSVIASRLASVKPGWRILLLEAGGDPSLLNAIPELAPYNLHQESTDWGYETVPQGNACLGMYNNQLAWPRGKLLGGCSSLNWMIYQRGCHKDYDQWVEATGDDGWGYDKLLPFFKKSENYHGWFPNATIHGTKGPLDVSRQYYTPSLEQWIEAGREMGFDTQTDPNSYQVPGFYPMDVTIYEGMRESTYRAFLEPQLFRQNLHVSRYSHVVKINLDDSKRSTGVTYIKDGAVWIANANYEVILSAGAIGTPHLLMLSGIGPASHLASVGVESIVDLPGVGQNLQDHVLTMFGPFLLDSPISYITDRDLTLYSVAEYARNRTGPFSFNQLSGIGYIATSQSSDPMWSDIEFHQSPLGLRITAADDFTAVFGLKPDILHDFFAPYILQDANFVLVDVGRPYSSGEIRLLSSSPFTRPLIDPKYYSDRRDMEAMIEALQFLLKMYEGTKSWGRYGAHLAPGKIQGCEQHPWRSHAYLECYIRTLTFTIYHPCGTARMGRDSDPLAVVNPQLKVRGVTSLRIADASVFPKITNANINAPVILVAEKLVDFILSGE